MASRQPRWRLRWGKAWETADGRGNVQKYLVAPGLILYDAWYGGRWLGGSHRLAEARALVKEAAQRYGRQEVA